MSADSQPAIELTAITRTYTHRRPARTVRALSELSLTVRQGEFVAVIGPSGCGKSTLLEIICGLQTPENGVCRAAPAALMPQADALLPWLSAIDNASLGLRLQGLDREGARRRARPWFERLGLAEFEATAVTAMSGGMRQRLSFLRTLLADKPVLCLDEPFGALDALTRVQAGTWLARALADPEIVGHTVVLVTHDVEEAVLLADRVIVLSSRPGRIIDELAVALPRPRQRHDAGVIALRMQALAALGVDG